MKGVEFELRDSDGKVLEKLVTDAAGHAESSLYEIATYKTVNLVIRSSIIW